MVQWQKLTTVSTTAFIIIIVNHWVGGKVTAINYMYEKPKRSITMMMIKMIMIIILIAIVICISSTGRVVRAAMSNKLMMARGVNSLPRISVVVMVVEWQVFAWISNIANSLPYLWIRIKWTNYSSTYELQSTRGRPLLKDWDCHVRQAGSVSAWAELINLRDLSRVEDILQLLYGD